VFIVVSCERVFVGSKRGVVLCFSCGCVVDFVGVSRSGGVVVWFVVCGVMVLIVLLVGLVNLCRRRFVLKSMDLFFHTVLRTISLNTTINQCLKMAFLLRTNFISKEHSANLSLH
jgi:hypothetical protein